MDVDYELTFLGDQLPGAGYGEDEVWVSHQRSISSPDLLFRHRDHHRCGAWNHDAARRRRPCSTWPPHRATHAARLPTGVLTPATADRLSPKPPSGGRRWIDGPKAQVRRPDRLAARRRVSGGVPAGLALTIAVAAVFALSIQHVEDLPTTASMRAAIATYSRTTRRSPTSA